MDASSDCSEIIVPIELECGHASANAPGNPAARGHSQVASAIEMLQRDQQQFSPLAPKLVGQLQLMARGQHRRLLQGPLARACEAQRVTRCEPR